jgi:hypothetical protein
MNKLIEKIDSIPSKWLAAAGIGGAGLIAIVILQSTIGLDLFRSSASGPIDIAQAPPAIGCQGPVVGVVGSGPFTFTMTGGAQRVPIKWYAPTGQIIGSSESRSVTVALGAPLSHDVIVVHGDLNNPSVPTRTAKCNIQIK